MEKDKHNRELNISTLGSELAEYTNTFDPENVFYRLILQAVCPKW